MATQAVVTPTVKILATSFSWLGTTCHHGLVLIVFALARTGRSSLAPGAVGAYIACAYFFTSSTSFANPAIVVGRMFSNTFAGIAPSSAPWFVVAELIGGLAGFGLVKALYRDITAREASHVTVEHSLSSEAPSR